MKRTLSNELINQAVKVMAGGVNSPVRAFTAVGGNPLVMDQERGSKLFDVDGQVPAVGAVCFLVGDDRARHVELFGFDGHAVRAYDAALRVRPVLIGFGLAYGKSDLSRAQGERGALRLGFRSVLLGGKR